MDIQFNSYADITEAVKQFAGIDAINVVAGERNLVDDIDQAYQHKYTNKPEWLSPKAIEFFTWFKAGKYQRPNHCK